MEITEKFLVSLGGWPAMKQARLLFASGRVSGASFEPPLLRGHVREGSREFVSTLRIRNSIDIDNLCPCHDSRVRGIICHHVMAVGLAVIHPSPQQTAGTATSSSITRTASAEASTQERPKVTVSIEGSLRHLEAQVDFSYSQPGTRNPNAEAAAMAQLLAAGFRDSGGKAVLSGENAVLTFYSNKLPEWRRTWDVVEGERFQHVTRDFLRIQPVCQLCDSGTGWLDFHVHYAAGAEAILSHADVQRLIQGGGSTRLKSGRIAVVDSSLAEDVSEVIRDCDPRQESGRYRIAARHRGYVEASMERWNPRANESKDATPIPLGQLEPLLRPYQKEGARWLLQRAQAGLGGLLADEMGLGKTVQALAMMEALRKAGGSGPALVICPSSLVWNWQSEAARFLPDFRVLAIEGGERAEKLAAIASADLVITSYGLLRRDVETYQDVKFSAVILDEAQHIKNPESKNAKAAATLRASARFILTGTPVENSLSDLWSLFEFLLPGYLGPRKDFRERYEDALASQDRTDVRDRLNRRIGPYVLRRTKAEILTDLPDKIEQILEVELTDKQKAAYTEIQRGARDQIDALAETSGDGATRMRVFTALLRLRQAACDLRLVSPEFPDPAEASAKLDALRELLAEAMDGGHRVLVFSQFTTMLDLIQENLKSDEIAHCRLDGSTKDRRAVVDRFQNDASIPVFLISLKAGGVGLNLTGADTVIHFDPWWNPAAEAQATDRAHRIGQKRVVTSIKLIARDTVEQRVLALQQRKRALFEGALATADESAAFDTEDLRELIG